MEEKRVIIFDLDGVLFDTVGLMYSLTKGEYPSLSYEEFKELHKHNIFESLERVMLNKAQETEDDRQRRYAIYTKNKSNASMHPGMRELVVSLSKKNHLVINTSAIEVNLIPLLKKSEIVDYFSFFATKELNPSKVEKFRLIAEKFNKKREEMLFITDTLGDLREASVAKVPTIVVTWGLHTKADFGNEAYNNLVSFVDDAQELEEAVKRA